MEFVKHFTALYKTFNYSIYIRVLTIQLYSNRRLTQSISVWNSFRIIILVQRWERDSLYLNILVLFVLTYVYQNKCSFLCPKSQHLGAQIFSNNVLVRAKSSSSTNTDKNVIDLKKYWMWRTTAVSDINILVAT